MNATFRHGNTDPNANAMKVPTADEIELIELIVPRTDGSLQYKMQFNFFHMKENNMCNVHTIFQPHMSLTVLLLNQN